MIINFNSFYFYAVSDYLTRGNEKEHIKFICFVKAETNKTLLTHPESMLLVSQSGQPRS